MLTLDFLILLALWFQALFQQILHLRLGTASSSRPLKARSLATVVMFVLNQQTSEQVVLQWGRNGISLITGGHF